MDVESKRRDRGARCAPPQAGAPSGPDTGGGRVIAGTMRTAAAFSLAAALALAPRPAMGEGEPAGRWEELQRDGAVIGRVEIRIGDVFDLDDPVENHLLGRAANLIHIDSREIVVRRELLFAEGDAVEARLVRESERNLRALTFIREARIDPVAAPDGTVTALVSTEDSWSLRGGFKFRYEGGRTEWGVDVEEVNLLGTGKRLRLAYEDNRERVIGKAGYRDPRILGSRWRAAGEVAELSDGHQWALSLGRPYYSLQAPWSVSAEIYDHMSDVRVYDLGEEAERYPARFRGVRLALGGAALRREGSVLRLGAEYRREEARYGDPGVTRPNDLPAPDVGTRDLEGGFLSARYLQERFIVARNLASIAATEDINLGWDVGGALGRYRSGQDGGGAVAGDFFGRKHWRAGERVTIKFAADCRGRREGGRWRNAIWGASLTLFDQGFSRQTLAAAVSWDGGSSLAPERWLTIGASDGLRGYPSSYLSGDRRWMLRLEDRIITAVEFWGMARLGFVAFADAGAIRRLDSGEWSPVYGDLGGGLRIGNLKSAFGRVVLATVAFPLVRGEGVSAFEIFVGNEIPF